MVRLGSVRLVLGDSPGAAMRSFFAAIILLPLYLLSLVLQVASGEVRPRAVRLGQTDFIPWKRGISL